MPKHVIVFGAGASFGSDRDRTPPMTNGLFDALASASPDTWGTLSDEDRDAFRSDFEASFERIDPYRLCDFQRAMSFFFYQFWPFSENLYRTLAKRIKARNWTGAIATLNYERMLEISLQLDDVKYAFEGLAAESDQVELCFPHGCCHFFCETIQYMPGSVSFNALQVSSTGRLVVPQNDISYHAQLFGNGAPPVMCYFEPKKRLTSGMNIIEYYQARYAELVLQAETVTVVGIQVRQHDIHIWDPLSKTNASVVYCSGPSAASTFDNWAKDYRPGKVSRSIPKYFADGFDDILTAAGLA